MDIQFETLDRWPYGGHGSGDRDAVFRATYPKTIALLKRELEFVNARNVALQTGHRGDDIRNDGWPRVNARLPRFAGVCLTFEKWTPNGQRNERGQALGSYSLLEFPCATFSFWEDNLRAIALTLQSIRAAKRYGVGRVERDEHYAGFKHKRVEAQTGTPANGKMSVEAASAVLAACAEGGWTAEVIGRSKDEMEKAYRAAAKLTHPDFGGTDHSMARVNIAAQVLRTHFGA